MQVYHFIPQQFEVYTGKKTLPTSCLLSIARPRCYNVWSTPNKKLKKKSSSQLNIISSFLNKECNKYCATATYPGSWTQPPKISLYKLIPPTIFSTHLTLHFSNSHQYLTTRVETTSSKCLAQSLSTPSLISPNPPSFRTKKQAQF